MPPSVSQTENRTLSRKHNLPFMFNTKVYSFGEGRKRYVTATTLLSAQKVVIPASMNHPRLPLSARVCAVR
jgi:hypothetical protein